MKRFMVVMLYFVLSIAVWHNMTQNTSAQLNSDVSRQSVNTDETQHINMTGDDSNILIAYFTWAENTMVENPNEIDVDATTSASVLLPGNAAKIANWIQERTGGNLFSIVVTEPYSSNYDKCLERVSDEKAKNARPKLVNYVENMDRYDIVFLGFPNWWYTVPMAIHSFLEEYDFSGKTIIPFVTHGTGGLASTIKDITTALPENVMILDPIGIYRSDVNTSKPAIDKWLDELGFTEKQQKTKINLETDTMRTITMTVDGQDISIVLDDTSVANALYKMLPLELSFEDFNGIEKISYLPDTLPTKGEPDRYDPDVGDFCLYAPWGNLSIFYEDFRESSGLIPLGHIQSGVEILSSMDSDFSATLKVEE